MMIEVIGDVALEHPSAPAAELPVAPMPLPQKPTSKSFGLMSYLSIEIVVCHRQHVWASHTLVGSMCTNACENEGHTKMNLLEIYRLDSIGRLESSCYRRCYRHSRCCSIRRLICHDVHDAKEVLNIQMRPSFLRHLDEQVETVQHGQTSQGETWNSE